MKIVTKLNRNKKLKTIRTPSKLVMSVFVCFTNLKVCNQVIKDFIKYVLQLRSCKHFEQRIHF